jgi:hypothetical protein
MQYEYKLVLTFIEAPYYEVAWKDDVIASHVLSLSPRCRWRHCPAAYFSGKKPPNQWTTCAVNQAPIPQFYVP